MFNILEHLPYMYVIMRLPGILIHLLKLFIYYCHLLITFANSLDPDQDQKNFGSDLAPNPSTLLKVFLKEFFKKVDFKKNSADHKKKSMQNFPVGKALEPYDWSQI